MPWPGTLAIQVTPVHGKLKSRTTAVCQRVKEIFLEYIFFNISFFSALYIFHTQVLFSNKRSWRASWEHKSIYWKNTQTTWNYGYFAKSGAITYHSSLPLICRISSGGKEGQRTNKITLIYPRNIFLSSVKCLALRLCDMISKWEPRSKICCKTYPWLCNQEQTIGFVFLSSPICGLEMTWAPSHS